MPAELVAQTAVQVPGLRQPERVEERNDFEKWTSLQDTDVEALDEQSLRRGSSAGWYFLFSNHHAPRH
ncbi:hypothetical protein [Paenibacillus graminis]|uniref:hypothetical protein n=1 Tax=Paenibacillus graminis TaxID=189425 RepID=UPI0004BBF233|nr:hypothetical protein [Paenibacillus graminis]